MANVSGRNEEHDEEVVAVFRCPISPGFNKIVDPILKGSHANGELGSADTPLISWDDE
jgi:hypothetical protein